MSNITILLTALLSSIGLSIIFGKSNFCFIHSCSNKEDIIDSDDPDNVNLNVSFSSSTKYVNTDNFKGANIRSSFAGVKVYFDNAKMADDTATISLDVSFSEVELYIPKDWEIVNKINTTLGEVPQKNRSNNKPDKKIILTGKVTLGKLSIYVI